MEKLKQSEMRQKQMENALGQKRATSVQIQNDPDHRGRVVTEDDKKKVKTRLQEETMKYLEDRKKKR